MFGSRNKLISSILSLQGAGGEQMLLAVVPSEVLPSDNVLPSDHIHAILDIYYNDYTIHYVPLFA